MDAKVRAKFMAELPRVHAQVLARALILVRGTGFRRRSMTPEEAASDLVQEAVVRALDGRRKWEPERVPDLEVFLFGAIRSIVSVEFRNAVKNESLDEEDSLDLDKVRALTEEATPESEHLRHEHVRHRIDVIFKATQNEELLLAVVEAVMDGCDKSSKVAARLGIPVEEVYKATRKITRRALILEQQLEEKLQ